MSADPLRAALDAQARLRATLDEERQRTRLLVDEALAGWWRWQIATETGCFSAGLKRRLGLPEDAPLDGYNHTLFHARLADWLAHPNQAFEGRIGMRHQAGHTVWLQARGTISARGLDGVPTQVQGVLLDLNPPQVPADEPARGDGQIKIDAAQLAALNNTLSRQAEQLARSNAALEDFAYAASHDLQTPLRAIAHFAAWIDEDLPPQSGQEVREHVARLLNRVERLGQLHTDLLAYARVNHTPIEPVRTDLRALMTAAWAAVGDPQFEWRCEGHVALQILPATQVRGLVEQVFKNAVMHHDQPPGRVVVRSTLLPDTVQIEIEDDGPGIEPRFEDKAFKVLETLRPRDAGAGSGVGLSIARRHAQRIGGRIALAPRDGRGACFIITLPRQDA